MSYDIYFKEMEGNEISIIIPDVFQLDETLHKINVPNIEINQGVLEIANFIVPLSNILFIKEV